MEREYINMTTPVPPYQSMYPYGFDNEHFLNTLQHQGIVNSITDNARGTTREVSAVDRHLSDGIMQLSGEIGNSTSKVVDTIGAQSLGLRDAVERNALNISNNVAGVRQSGAESARDIQVAIERTALSGLGATERVGSSVLSTVERTSGEAKLTTAISDAATRQATNDLARDIIGQTNKGSMDIMRSLSENRYTGAVSDAATRQATNDLARDIILQTNKGTVDILGSLSENRYTTAVSDAATRQATNDLARDIINQTNKGSTDIISAIAENRFSATVNDAATRQTNSDLARDIITQLGNGHSNLMASIERNGDSSRELISSSGYETRTLLNQRSTESLMEHARAKEDLARQAAQQYSSLLLENHKSVDALSSQTSNQYASTILEQQKVLERVTSQSSNQYASLLLEQQKTKEYMSNQMADSKYEALKNKEMLAAQIAAAASDSKYEALKNTQTLSSQMAECCCEIKSKIGDVSNKMDDTVRTLDTNRLRDSLNTANNEVNLLKILEHTRGGFGGHHGGYGHGHNYHDHHYHGGRDRSRSRSRSPGRR